jgi:hypothetical protein
MKSPAPKRYNKPSVEAFAMSIAHVFAEGIINYGSVLPETVTWSSMF